MFVCIDRKNLYITRFSGASERLPRRIWFRYLRKISVKMFDNQHTLGKVLRGTNA